MTAERMTDIEMVKHFKWVSPVALAIQATLLLNHSFYEVVHFDLLYHFDLFDHDV